MTLLHDIEDYLLRTGMSASTFGQRSGLGKPFVLQYRQGRQPGHELRQRAVKFMADNPLPMTPTQSTVYKLLRAKADAGEPCPRNSEICFEVGLNSGSSVAHVLHNLERGGHISVVRYQNEREITIVATGQVILSKPMTRAKVRKPHISRARGIAAGHAAKDLPESRYLVRDPCFMCGTRRDLGCEHYPLEAMAA